ncbi:MAG: paraquat-inducible protein A [Campylobacterota bacterium]|nr:paraquat-inducible protein A [Campylobacterota bacterium]
MNKTACKGCGIIVEYDTIEDNFQYSCPRCHSVIYRSGQPLEYVVAVSISSIIFILSTISLPLLSISGAGEVMSVNLHQAVVSLAADGYGIISIVVMLMVIVFPISMLILILLMITPSFYNKKALYFEEYYKIYEQLRHWSAPDVYLLAIIVSLIKLHNSFEVELGYGIATFGLFLLTFFAATVWFNPQDIWLKYE